MPCLDYICRLCGAKNDHLIINCPQSKCAYCESLSHGFINCPNALGANLNFKVVCTFCQFSGHNYDECLPVLLLTKHIKNQLEIGSLTIGKEFANLAINFGHTDKDTKGNILITFRMVTNMTYRRYKPNQLKDNYSFVHDHIKNLEAKKMKNKWKKKKKKPKHWKKK
jgi:hypothetical protein